MRLIALLALAALLSPGCDGSDISDNPPVSGDGDGDGDGDASVDGSQGDAGADASADRAQAFCDRYEATCTYDNMDANRFDDEQACLDGFNGFDAGQQDCVELAITQAEGGNLNACRSATGLGPCGN